MTYGKFRRVFFRKTLLFLSKILFIILLFFPYFIKAAGFTSTILSQDKNHIRIRYHFEKPQMVKANGKIYAIYNKAVNIIDQNGANVPVVTDIISLAGKEADVRILSKKQKSIAADNYLISDVPDNKNIKSVAIRYMGLYRDVSAFSLTVMPVSYNNSTKKLIWTAELVIEINNKSSITEKETYSIKRKPEENYKNLFINNNLYQKNIHAENLKAISFSKNSAITSNYSVIYKIRINQTGLYKITYDDLKNVNFPVDDINPKNLRLLNKGTEIPVYMTGSDDGTFDSKDYFEFWGERNEKTFLKQYNDLYNDPFTDNNIYWLVESNAPGLRLVEESGGITETDQSKFIIPLKFKDTEHFEKDTHWERFGYNPEYIDDLAYKYDLWYWGQRISAVSSRKFIFNLSNPVKQGANVFVTAMFRGVSIPGNTTNQIKGHQVSVWLNSEKVGEILPKDDWIGQKKASISNSNAMSQSNLVNGNNELRVDMDKEGALDAVLLNWFDITYDKKYRADKGILKFRLQDDLFSENKIIQFQIDGFQNNDIDVFKLGTSKIVNGRVDLYRNSDENFISYRITFQDQVYDPNVEYLAIAENAKLKPDNIEEYQPWKKEDPLRTLLDKDNAADLLIITHNLFLDQALRLKDIKNQEGYTTEVVTVGQIYDTFNNGIKSPLAIKDFLRYVYYNWDQTKKLKYVILTGDATYDYKDLMSSKYKDFVPTILYSTNKYGAAAADYQYACLSGDDLIPDIAVGRIPASTASELSDYIDKIEEYENSNDYSAWRNRALFISGDDAVEGDKEKYTQKPVFRAQNERMLSFKLPQNVFAYQLSVVDNDPNFGNNIDLKDYFDNGLTYVNFFGHGGGLIWSDQHVLQLNDVDNLNNNGEYPFVSSMTCYTGAFESVSQEGLAEKLVMAAHKGAIAVLASSATGWTYNDFAIQWSLHDYLWDGNTSFGEAVDKMKMSYMAGGIYYTGISFLQSPSFSGYNGAPLWSSMVNQYNLLGDPTLKIQKSDNNLSVRISDRTPDAGQKITLSVNAPFNSGTGIIEISGEDNSKYLNQNFTFSSGQYNLDYNVPSLNQDSLIVGKFFKVKAFVSNGSEASSAYNNYSVDGPIISSVKTNPENPQVNDAVNFDVIAKSNQPIEHMELRNFRSENSAGDDHVTLVMYQVNDSLFRSLSSHPAFNKGGTYYFEIYVRDTSGMEKRYDLNKIVINDNRPDIKLDGNSIRYTGTKQLQLTFTAQNNSEINVDSVLIDAFTGKDTVYNQYYSFGPNEKRIFYAPLKMDTVLESRVFKVEIDPDNVIAERHEDNNSFSRTIPTDHIFVDSNLGSSSDGIKNNVVPILKKWDFYLNKNNIAASSVVSFKDSVINNQKNLKYIPFKFYNDTTGLYISIKNSAANADAMITTYIDNTKNLTDASFYRYDTYIGLWAKISSVTDSAAINGKISAEINRNGLYAVFISGDKNKPSIEITANGRPLSNNGLVKSNPSIAFLLQDEGGIDFNNTFKVLLDDQPIPSDQLTIPDSINNASSIAVSASPQLKEGTHWIDVFISDLNKNEASVHVTFKVSAENQFVVYGNYPNPFQTTTTIAYYNNFGNNLSKLETKIYTVSGQLIRSKMLDPPEGTTDYDPTNIFYGELVWDGTDDDGTEVANGVYFVVIKAEYIQDFPHRKINFKKILKVAKLK